MNLFNKLFSYKEQKFNIPSQHSVLFGQVGVDFQVVLMSKPIKNKEIAEKYAELITEKHGVRTKVSDNMFNRNETSYLIWIYRIDLDIINNIYDEKEDAWRFFYEDLKKLPCFDFDRAIKSTQTGWCVDAYLSTKIQEDNQKFTLLFENSYYQYYKYFGNTLLRHDKESGYTLVVGRFANIVDCALYHNKLYVAANGNTKGNREIYKCELDGTNPIELQCLNNEKTTKIDHCVSVDSVKKMSINNDSLEILVQSNDDIGKYDYKLLITESEGEVAIKKVFI